MPFTVFAAGDIAKVCIARRSTRRFARRLARSLYQDLYQGLHMPIATTALSIAGAAAAVVLYVRHRRARSTAMHRRSAARVAAAAPVRDSAVDLFLFEKSFGWECARLLLATSPVAIGLLAVLWFMRSAP